MLEPRAGGASWSLENASTSCELELELMLEPRAGVTSWCSGMENESWSRSLARGCTEAWSLMLELDKGAG